MGRFGAERDAMNKQDPGRKLRGVIARDLIQVQVQVHKHQQYLLGNLMSVEQKMDESGGELQPSEADYLFHVKPSKLTEENIVLELKAIVDDAEANNGNSTSEATNGLQLVEELLQQGTEPEFGKDATSPDVNIILEAIELENTTLAEPVTIAPQLVEEVHQQDKVENGCSSANEHAWYVLSKKKWRVDNLKNINQEKEESGSSTKRSRVSIEDAVSSNSTPETPTSMYDHQPFDRTDGIKSAKRKGKQRASRKGKKRASTTSDEHYEALREREKVAFEFMNQLTELKKLREARKLEKQKDYVIVKKIDVLLGLMADKELTPSRMELKERLMKELKTD